MGNRPGIIDPETDARSVAPSLLQNLLALIDTSFSNTVIPVLCGSSSLDILIVRSRMAETLLDEEKEAGTYGVEFSAKGGNASNLLGNEVGPSDGIFVYRLQAGDFSATKTMLLERA